MSYWRQLCPGILGQAVFDALLKRERLGSTGLGSGIALPHGRVPALQSPLVAVVTLRTGIDFDALDGRPIDIVFALAVPENCEDQHLQILAGIAEMCSDSGLREALRRADSSVEVQRLLNGWRHCAESA